MERRIIPGPLLAIAADIASRRESHATLDSLFTYAGAPGDPPGGSKPAKAQEWLRRANKDDAVDPLAVIGRVIENYMEKSLDPDNSWDEPAIVDRRKLTDALAEAGLQYVKGGKVIGSLGAASKSLEEVIRERSVSALDHEFERATSSVETEPREAVSAASNLLESVCKVYIEDEGLSPPAKQDLQAVWGVVRKDLGFDPSKTEDQDLQTILSGLISVVHGIGALRTHASSAHGAGRRAYRLEPRHARLAVHAAHTVALFILESWSRKATTPRT
jgi:hypothetical protein